MRASEDDAYLMGPSDCLRSCVHLGAFGSFLILCFCMGAGGGGFKTAYSRSPGDVVM